MPARLLGNPSSGRGGGLFAAFAAGQEGRLILWLAPAFGLGIAVYVSAMAEPGAFVWAGAALVGLGALISARKVAMALLVVALCGGFLWAGLRAELAAGPTLVAETPPLTLTAHIDDVEPREGAKARLVLSRLSLDGGLWGSAERAMPDGLPQRVRVTVRQKGDGLLPGMIIRATVILRAPPSPVMPGGYDFARAAYFDGLGGVGFILGSADVIGIEGTNLEGGLTRARIAITQQVMQHLSGDSGALAVALLTGFRGPVDEGVLTDFRNAGLAHMLAISGLHVGLVAGGVFMILRLALVGAMLAMRRWRPAQIHLWPTKQIAAGGALIVAAIYLGLSGMNVPAERAFIMTGLALIAIMIGRTALSLRLVAIAALIVMLLHPYSVMTAGFQMSFAAVTALIAFYEAMRPYSQTLFGDGVITRLRGYVIGLALTSIIAGLATGPIAAFHFGRMALFGLLGNLAAMPIMGFMIMPAGIIALVLMPFGLERLPLELMGLGIDWVTIIAGKVAGLPFAERLVAEGPDSALFSIIIGGLMLSLISRRMRFLGIVPVLLGFTIWAITPIPQVFIGEKAALVMVDDQVSQTRRYSYVKNQWAEASGQTQAGLINASCDRVGCVFDLPHDAGTLSQLYQRDGLVEACANAAIIVAPFYINRYSCKGPLLIDAGIIAGSDALAIHVDRHGQFSLTHSQQRRAARPWGHVRNKDYMADRLLHVEQWNAAARLLPYQD